ncbi:MAG TPA: aminotransferase class IV [Actinomycetes bacterium]
MADAARVLDVLVAGPGAPAGDQAGLSPLDLGLLRGDAVFESVRVYRGRPFRLDAHLARLAVSAAGADLAIPAGLEELAERAVAACAGGDGVLRLLCTRGAEDEDAPALVAVVTGIPPGLDADRRRGIGIALLTTAADPLLRAGSPWLLAGVKTTSYAVNMAARRAAQAKGADDAVFVGLGGELLEAPTANLWWRSGQVLYTPALELGILAGITRVSLMELAGPAGYRVVEGVFTADDLIGAEEAFLSSTVAEVMPVVEVDGVPIGRGRPGRASKSLQAALRRLAGA